MESTAEQEYVVYCSACSNGRAGEQSTKHRGKGGGPTLPELPDQLRGACPFVENLHPRFGRLARFQPQPRVQPGVLCSAPPYPSVGQDQSVVLGNGGGRGDVEGVCPRGGWGGLGGRILGRFGLDWPGGRQPQVCRVAGTGTRHRLCARVGQEPCPPHAPPLHPAPCTLEPGQPLLLLPPQPPCWTLVSVRLTWKTRVQATPTLPCSLPKRASDSHTLDQHHRSPRSHQSPQSPQSCHIHSPPGPSCTIAHIASCFLINTVICTTRISTQYMGPAHCKFSVAHQHQHACHQALLPWAGKSNERAAKSLNARV